MFVSFPGGRPLIVLQIHQGTAYSIFLVTTCGVARVEGENAIFDCFWSVRGGDDVTTVMKQTLLTMPLIKGLFGLGHFYEEEEKAREREREKGRERERKRNCKRREIVRKREGKRRAGTTERQGRKENEEESEEESEEERRRDGGRWTLALLLTHSLSFFTFSLAGHSVAGISGALCFAPPLFRIAGLLYQHAALCAQDGAGMLGTGLSGRACTWCMFALGDCIRHVGC